jgi:glycosyltransferase involved in cell wall biosynthesis
MNGFTVGEIAIGMNGSMLDEKPSGVGVYSFNLINNLAGMTNLTVFTPSRVSLDAGIKIVKLPNLLQSSKYGKLAAFSRFVWNAVAYPFQARSFDLLISPTTHGSILSDNQIITVHDLISLRYTNISFHQRLYFKYFLPLLLKRSKLIIAVSESTKRDILHYFKCPEDKVKVIYNGYDHLSYYPIRKKEHNIYKEYGQENYLLAIGPTYAHKNFEILIRAYGELAAAFRDRHPLVIAGGKEPYLGSLKKVVRALHLERRIIFLGYVPIVLMPSLYREAFLLVFPSLYEGFGIPLLEAMASGCPVVVSNTSSMPEVCGDAVLYFDPLDSSALSSSISRVIGDKRLREDLVEKGIRRAREFSWHRMACSFNTLIEQYFANKQLNN